MATITFQRGIELKQIATNTFESIQRSWTWHGTRTIPGGVLMSLAAAAAYKTVHSDFAIDCLQTFFVSAANPDVPLKHKVTPISDSGRFATRLVIVEQAGTVMVQATCSFVRTSGLAGPSMEHSVSRKTSHTVDAITIDDLEPGRTSNGPYMKFQRLAVDVDEHQAEERQPQSMTYTSAALISPPMEDSDRKMHALGLLCLSDYHILDGPPTLHGLTFGLPLIGDVTQTPTESRFRLFTSLNHTVHFHLHDGFRADELCYIEVTSPWSGQRRAEIQSRIFDRNGTLLATCVQGAYYVLNDLSSEHKL